MTITQSRLKELLHYDPVTGVFTWKYREGARSTWNTRFAGKRAGSIGRSSSIHGYNRREIRLEGRLYKEHRLAFLYMEGWLPVQVDHNNRDATDNRWCNLVPSDYKSNGRNQSLPRNSTSGVCGVYWNKGCQKWQAHARVNGKLNYLGLFKNIDEAAMEVLEFRLENGFSREHGLEVAHYHMAQQEVVNHDHHT